MKMIVGLGNPGSKYSKTKHNIGFMTIAALSEALAMPLTKHEFNALTGSGRVNDEKVLLVQPQTFMNDSGRAVGELKAFYQFQATEILIIQDDMDMSMGRLRLRQRGSAGGHNGIKSIINVLGTQDFYRLKIGIQHPQKQRVVDWVLTPFTEADQALINTGIDRAVAACQDFISGVPFAALMNKYN